jgi:excisionase family DNA binding protein
VSAVLERQEIEQRMDDADEAIIHAYGTLRNTGAQLVGLDGTSHELPPSIYNFLVRLISDLAAKRSVAIIHSESTLTTVQACQLLGVSRQHLVNLLESGHMPFHKVGTHRRIYAGDLLAYKEKRDQKRKKAIDSFSDLERDEYLG